MEHTYGLPSFDIAKTLEVFADAVRRVAAVSTIEKPEALDQPLCTLKLLTSLVQVYAKRKPIDLIDRLVVQSKVSSVVAITTLYYN